MYQDIFIPSSFTIEFESSNPYNLNEYEDMLTHFMTYYIQNIEHNKNVLIGHIKALAEFPENSFIKFSYTGSKTGLNLEKNYTNSPVISNFIFIFNSLVSEISHEKTNVILQKCREELLKQYPVLSIEITTPEHPLHTQNEDICPECGEHHGDENHIHHNHDNACPECGEHHGSKNHMHHHHHDKNHH